jgi:hypothetical protein
VAGRGQLDPAAEAVALDRRDGRDVELLVGGERVLQPAMNASSGPCWAIVAKTDTSIPDEKTPPRPATTTAPTSGSAAASAARSVSWRNTSRLMALRLSGRSIVTWATRSTTS